MAFASGSLTSFSHNGVTTWRTRRQLAHAKDSVYLCLQEAGSGSFSQYGRDVSLSHGDISLVDNSTQANFTTSLNSRKLMLELSRKDCEARLGNIQHSVARRIDGTHGVGKLLATFMQSLPALAPQLSASAQSQIALQVIDLAAVALSEGSGSSQSAGRMASLLRLKAVVDANLSNSSVTCEELAGAAGISVRYANQLLRPEDTSLRRLLFSRRIAKCQAALADPTQAHRQISDIAFVWGFDDASHFGRLFKDISGMTPRTYRLQRMQR